MSSKCANKSKKGGNNVKITYNSSKKEYTIVVPEMDSPVESSTGKSMLVAKGNGLESIDSKMIRGNVNLSIPMKYYKA